MITTIHRLPIFFGLVSFLLWFSISNQPTRAAEFIPLGDLADGRFASWAFATSGDYKRLVVVGMGSSEFGREAFYWTPASGMVSMGDLPDEIFDSAAFGVSADGLVIVGKGTSDSGDEAFRWEAGPVNCEEGQMNCQAGQTSLAAGQMTGLGDLEGGEFTSGAWDVSGDGSVIVGAGTSEASSPDVQAFRLEGEVMTPLGEPQEAVIVSRAKGISNDGSVVVGSREVEDYREEAFRWEGGEMTGLGVLGRLPSGSRWSSRWSRSWAASDDGSVIVGTSSSPEGQQAFRWEAGEMIGLGDLPEGAFSSIAYSVSGNGSVIVGTGSSAASDDPQNEAFIWNSVNGMRGLQNVLENHMGLDLPGWTLTAARDISYHSRVITGYGINPDGNQEAWLVLSWEQSFEPIPDPPTFTPSPYPLPDLPPIPDPFPALPDFPFPVDPERHSWIIDDYQVENLIWSDGKNWDGGGIGPQSDWDIQIDNKNVTTGQTVIVDADSVVHSIDLGGIGGTMSVVIEKNVTLTVLDGITVGPGGILKGAGTVVGVITNLGGTVHLEIPEPAGFVLVALGLVGLVCWFPDPMRRP